MNMSYLKLIASMSILAATTAAATEPETLVCRGKRAYILAITYNTGCKIPSVPEITATRLRKSGPSQGTIDVKIDYSWPVKDPDCVNPRGAPFAHYLPLPLGKGEWKVRLDGQVLGALAINEQCVLLSSQ
jgi:hypothetical protein